MLPRPAKSQWEMKVLLVCLCLVEMLPLLEYPIAVLVLLLQFCGVFSLSRDLSSLTRSPIGPLLGGRDFDAACRVLPAPHAASFHPLGVPSQPTVPPLV